MTEREGEGEEGRGEEKERERDSVLWPVRQAISPVSMGL